MSGSGSEDRQSPTPCSQLLTQANERDQEMLQLEESIYCSSAEKVELTSKTPPATTLAPRVFDRIKQRIAILTERIEQPFTSQPIEMMHAFLKLRNCAAAVFEPILVVEDDVFGRLRAALWPSFRHLGAWKRDRIFNEVKNELKGATAQQLFIEASKRLKVQEEDDTVELDIHSTLMVRTLFERIGQLKGFKHLLNIAQQFASIQESELHFEYLKFDNKRPLRHVRVDAEGDCWISTLMVQIQQFSTVSEWAVEDHEEEWGAIITQADIMKQRKWLAVRMRAQPELLTSWTECISKEGEEVKIPALWKKQKHYTMLQALKMEDEYKRLANEHIFALTSLGIPLDPATVLYNVYGSDTQAAVDHYDRERSTVQDQRGSW